MKYLLDCGSAQFQGLNQLLADGVIDATWNVVCFEANPFTHARSLPKLPAMQKKLASIHALNAALAASSGIVTMNCGNVKHDSFSRLGSPSKQFFKRAKHSAKQFVKNQLGTKSFQSQSSTILATPPTADGDHQFEYQQTPVTALSLSDIINSLEDCQTLKIKLDIEGAEFDVLEDLIARREETQILPEAMYIEWHERFFDSSPEILDRKATIMQTLTDLGVELHGWV